MHLLRQNVLLKVLILPAFVALLQACGGSSASSSEPVVSQQSRYIVTVSTAVGGEATPSSQSFEAGTTANIRITPDVGYRIASVAGCNGTLSEDVYTIDSVAESCTLSVEFAQEVYEINVFSSDGGSTDIESLQLMYGETAEIVLMPDAGFYVDSVSGCEGSLYESVYSLALVQNDCSVEVTFQAVEYVEGDLTFSLDYGENRAFYFSWNSEVEWQQYRLLANEAGSMNFEEVALLGGDVNHYKLNVALHTQSNTQYMLEACAGNLCEVSNIVKAQEYISEAVETLKVPGEVASCESAFFSQEVAVSSDGLWMVLLNNEYLCQDSNNEGVVIYNKRDHKWHYHSHMNFHFSEDHYVNNPHRGRQHLALSGNGSKLAIGVLENAPSETEGSQYLTRKVYVYQRLDQDWLLEGILQAPRKNESSEGFKDLILSDDGMTLAYSGIYSADHPCFYFFCPDDSEWMDYISEGNIYVHKFREGSWSDAVWIRNYDTRREDWFGYSFDLSGDGNRLVIGAPEEKYAVSYPDKSHAIGVVYVYNYDQTWKLEKTIKPGLQNKDVADHFGSYVSMSSSGEELMISVSEQELSSFGSIYVPFSVHQPYTYYFHDGQWSGSVINDNTINFKEHTLKNATLSGDGRTMAARVNYVENCHELISGSQNYSVRDYQKSGVVVFYQLNNDQWNFRNCINSPFENESLYSGFPVFDETDFEYSFFGLQIFLNAEGSSLVTQGGLWHTDFSVYESFYPILIY